MENRTIDARGLACPLPVVNAKKAAAETGFGSKELYDASLNEENTTL